MISTSLNHCEKMGAEPGRRFLKQPAAKLEPVIVVKSCDKRIVMLHGADSTNPRARVQDTQNNISAQEINLTIWPAQVSGTGFLFRIAFFCKVLLKDGHAFHYIPRQTFNHDIVTLNPEQQNNTDAVIYNCYDSQPCKELKHGNITSNTSRIQFHSSVADEKLVTMIP